MVRSDIRLATMKAAAVVNKHSCPSPAVATVTVAKTTAQPRLTVFGSDLPSIHTLSAATI